MNIIKLLFTWVLIYLLKGGLLKDRCGNDPSAGSPTETLLRLHLPLNDEVCTTSQGSVSNERDIASIRRAHRTIQSVGATGGVYKGQGRNQCALMTHVY